MQLALHTVIILARGDDSDGAPSWKGPLKVHAEAPIIIIFIFLGRPGYVYLTHDHVFYSLIE